MLHRMYGNLGCSCIILLSSRFRLFFQVLRDILSPSSRSFVTARSKLVCFCKLIYIDFGLILAYQTWRIPAFVRHLLTQAAFHGHFSKLGFALSKLKSEVSLRRGSSRYSRHAHEPLPNKAKCVSSFCQDSMLKRGGGFPILRQPAL